MIYSQKTKQKNKGTTIVELLIYVALLAIFLTMLVNVFVTTLNFKLESESTSALNQDTRYILSKLSYDIYNSDSITTPLNFGDTSSNLVISNGAVTNTYATSSGNLLLASGGTSMKLNGNDTNVQSILFKKIGNSLGKPTIQIVITVQSNIQLTGGVYPSQTIQTTVGLR